MDTPKTRYPDIGITRQRLPPPRQGPGRPAAAARREPHQERRRPGVGPAPRGWHGPSRPAGEPGGRRIWRPGASCRPPPGRAVAGRCGHGRPATRRCAGQDLGVQTGQGPADGGLRRDGPMVGSVAAGADRGPDRLGGISGPFGDRGHRLGAGQHRGSGHGKDGYERVAAATGGSRIGDGGKVGEQVRGLGLLEGVGVGELGQGGRDRGS